MFLIDKLVSSVKVQPLWQGAALQGAVSDRQCWSFLQNGNKNWSAEIKLTKQREEGVWSGQDTVCCWDKRKQRKEDSNQRRNGNVNRVSVDRLSEVYQIWIRERIVINPPQALCWNSSHNCSHPWGENLHLIDNLPESAPTTAIQQCCFPLKASSDLWKMLSWDLRTESFWCLHPPRMLQVHLSMPFPPVLVPENGPSHSQTQQRSPVCGDNAQTLEIGW